MNRKNLLNLNDWFMKRIFFLSMFYCISFTAFSQEKKILETAKFNQDSSFILLENNDTVYLTPHINAGFNGGQDGWDKYLTKNINESVPERNGAKPGTYNLQALFIVEKNGSIDIVEIINDPGYGTSQEVKTVLKNSPKWNPAKNNGINVKCLRSLNTSFIVKDNIEDSDFLKAVAGDSLFNNVEIQASFPGGQFGWEKYLRENLNPLVPSDNKAPAGTYTVSIGFIVGKDGKVSDVEAIKDPGYGTAEEAIRVIKKEPKWSPGIKNGKIVKSYREQNITYMVQNQ